MLRLFIRNSILRRESIRRFSTSPPNKIEDLEKQIASLQKKVEDQNMAIEHCVGITFGLVIGVIYLAGTKKNKNT